MKRTEMFYLLLISGICSITLGSSDFHLIKLSKNFSEARNYCTEMYTDLATIHNSTDMTELITVASTTARAWIGLEAGGVWMWHWSRPDQKPDYFNWKAGQPLNNNEDACAAMSRDGSWFESDCRTERSFVCQGRSEASGDIFVAENKTWRNAQSHCRDLLSDLVSIHSAEKNGAVLNVSVTQSVWIGLFKDPWRWSDGSLSSFRHWKPLQPNYREGQDCVAAVFKDQGRWNDLRCSTKRHFVCRGASKYIPATTSPTSTEETLNTALTTPPTTSSNEDIATVYYNTSASTNYPNTTNATPIEHLDTSSTELNNATKETSTQLPSTATDGSSALTTPKENSAHPSITNTSVLAENLILIQENMSWIHAMSYCRKHHIDLVHITSKDIQEKVAAIAKNATSPYVWIGLRYTCKFNFWFWTSSTNTCYQNWAPGQGSERKYDCGVTGAVVTTRGQQWIGLSGTKTLNFICVACAG